MINARKAALPSLTPTKPKSFYLSTLTRILNAIFSSNANALLNCVIQRSRMSRMIRLLEQRKWSTSNNSLTRTASCYVTSPTRMPSNSPSYSTTSPTSLFVHTTTSCIDHASCAILATTDTATSPRQPSAAIRTCRITPMASANLVTRTITTRTKSRLAKMHELKRRRKMHKIKMTQK